MSDRLVFLCLGLVVGFLAGVITNSLHTSAKEQATIPESTVPDKRRYKLFNKTAPTSVGLFLVLAFTVWASIVTQLNANDVAQQQEDNAKRQQCTTKFLADTISALNSRTTYSVEQNQANSDLLDAQVTFLRTISAASGATPAQRSDALTQYLVALDASKKVLADSKAQIVSSKYPTIDQLEDCLNS